MLYGRIGEELVFAPLAEVEWASWLEKVTSFIASGRVKSWRELKDSVPIDVYQDIVGVAEPETEPESEEDDAGLRYWADEMAWPPDLDGEWFVLREESTAVKAFENLGYECVRDDDRIWRCFWWWY